MTRSTNERLNAIEDRLEEIVGLVSQTGATISISNSTVTNSSPEEVAQAVSKVMSSPVPGDSLAETLWESVNDKGIKGRLYREDCDYLARVAREQILIERGGLGAKVVPALKRQIAEVEAERDEAQMEHSDAVAELNAAVTEHEETIRDLNIVSNKRIKDLQNAYSQMGSNYDAMRADVEKEYAKAREVHDFETQELFGGVLDRADERDER